MEWWAYTSMQRLEQKHLTVVAVKLSGDKNPAVVPRSGLRQTCRGNSVTPSPPFFVSLSLSSFPFRFHRSGGSSKKKGAP